MNELMGVSVSVSVLTLSCISIERWYAICHPLLFKSTPERARLMICVIWLIALCILVPEIVVLDTHPRYPGVTVMMTSCAPMGWSESNQEAYQLFISIGLFVCPLLLMFFTYAHIAKCLWSNAIPTETTGMYATVPTCVADSKDKSLLGNHSKRKGRDQLHPSTTNVNAEMQLQSRRKAARMLIAVVVMFGICYLPVHLLNILRYAGALKDASAEVTYFALIAHWMCYFNSAINPVIYNFMSAKFRKEFQKACSCCGMCCSSPADRRHPDNTYAYRYSNTLATNLANMDKDKAYSRGGATRITNC